MRMRRAAMVALVTLALALASSPLAVADSPIVASDPQPRAELSARPGWVTLVFARNADVSLAKILVLDGEGQNVTVGPLIVEGTNVTTQLSPDLQQDTFTVMYRIDRIDGQPEGGAFQFAYGKGNWTEVTSRWSGQSEEPEVIRNPNPKPTAPRPGASGPRPTSYAPSMAPSTTPTSTGRPTPTASSPSPRPAPATQYGPGSMQWILGVGVIGVALAVGVGAAVMKRRGH